MSANRDRLGFSKNRVKTWIWSPVAGTIAIALYLLLPTDWRNPELLITVVGGVFTTAFLLRTSHAEDTQFMYQLFTDFNRRYDALNDHLMRIESLASVEEISPGDRAVVIDYFNLCSEEFVFYEAGFISKAVWRSWRAGMAEWGNVLAIRQLWEKECGNKDIYYGFEFPVSR